MATRYKPTFDERVKEYVDSPLMVQRFRHEQYTSAQIRGNFGNYRTIVNIKAKDVEGVCDCPSELQPCKHLHALRETWNKRPDSFFNLDEWLVALRKEPQETLVEAIRNMILNSPHLLTIFGVSGFEDDEPEFDDYYD